MKRLCLAVRRLELVQLNKIWSEPLKWHTELATVSGRGTTSGEETLFPEISANGCRTHGDL